MLSAFRPSSEPEERSCRTLESYCAYAAFAAKSRRAQQLKGCQTIAVASALRSLLGFPFGDLFFAAAHGPAAPDVNTPIVDMLLRNVYRVRRKLTEYAG